MTSKEVFDLMTRFESSSIHTMKLSSGDFSIELSKGPVGAVGSVPAMEQRPSVPVPAAAEPAPESPVITAPLVGTYYAASTPGAAPFVHVGDTVKKGQTVCLIEAMKMMSEIPAPCDCVITEVLKEHGALAAFGEPLFRYQPC